MIRPVFTELALFLAPFVVYAIYLVATKSALLTLASWPPKVLATLGICALVLDHILGEAASDGLTQPKFTGTITVRYLRGTPLGLLRAEAYIDRTEGVKTFARGYLIDAEGTTVEAEGVFIRPAWAREVG